MNYARNLLVFWYYNIPLLERSQSTTSISLMEIMNVQSVFWIELLMVKPQQR